MCDQPLVSVIIPSFRRTDTLARAVDSILKQTYKNIEIIVVDDNGMNSVEQKATEALMNIYANEQRVIYIKHGKNKGRSAARNTGISISKGFYVMFLDNDDEFLPNKVAAQIKRLESLDSNWGACYTKYIRKKNGKTIVYSAENREGKLLEEAIKRNLFIHAGSNLMIRRSVIIDVGGFKEHMSYNEDVELLVRILTKYKIAFADELGLVVHIYSKNNNNKFKDITDIYTKEILTYIEKLPECAQKRVWQMFKLQLFRNLLTFKGSRRQALSMIKNRELDPHLVFKYMQYLIWRKVTKKSFGFVYYDQVNMEEKLP
jgi:glycosyltransferase involved in cell wall biosynthesis